MQALLLLEMDGYATLFVNGWINCLNFQTILESCEDAGSAQVISVTKKPRNKWRPTALDTVEFEKLAVRKLHMSAKVAMAVAERLYNKGDL